MAKQGYRVMDSDMHVVEPPDLWERYIDPAFRHQAPRTVDDPDIPVDIRLEFAGRAFTRTNIHSEASRHSYLMRRQRTAPKYTGLDKVNPGSLILSAVMMLEHLGWNEAAEAVNRGMQGAVAAKTVTYDLERQMEGATTVKTSEFAQAVIEHM